MFKKILIALALLGGGYYYLVHIHFAPKKNDFLDKYDSNESTKVSNVQDGDYEVDVSKYLKNNNIEKKEKVEHDYSNKLYRSLYDEDASQYKCDGRSKCTEMRSCDEAKFFLKNCPATLLDKDNNGIPCEEQWCTKSHTNFN